MAEVVNDRMLVVRQRDCQVRRVGVFVMRHSRWQLVLVAVHLRVF